MPEYLGTRFWGRVKIGPPEPCWEWTGHKDKDGYGHFKVAGTMKRAHRLVYRLIVGPIPKGLCVLHRCDNPSCVNPTHLFLGTIGDNNRDRASKGRSGNQNGSQNNMAKLTNADVIEIRKLLRAGWKQKEIAAKFNVKRESIGKIKRKERWIQLEDEYNASI